MPLLVTPMAGWPSLIWLVLFFIVLAAGPHLLPGRLGRGWAALFASAPPLSTHGSAHFGQAQDATAAGHLVPAVLSTVVWHTAWLDDPRLCAALAHSDFTLADLKRRRVTI